MADEHKKLQAPPAAKIMRQRKRLDGPTSGGMTLEEQLRRLEQMYQGGDLDVFGVDEGDFGDEISELHEDMVGQLGIDVYELAHDVFEAFAQQHLELYPSEGAEIEPEILAQTPAPAPPVLELLDDEEEEAQRLAQEAAERARQEAARRQAEREEAARQYVLRRQQERAQELALLREQQRQEAARQQQERATHQRQAIDQEQFLAAQQEQARRQALKRQEELAQLMAEQELRHQEQQEQDARRQGRAQIYTTGPTPAYTTQPGTVATIPSAVQQLLETSPGLQYDSAPVEDHLSAEERANRLNRLTQRYFDRKADMDRERLRSMVRGSDIEREVHDVKLDRLSKRVQEMSEPSVPQPLLSTQIPATPEHKETFNKAFQAFKKQFYTQALPLFEEAHKAQPQESLYTTFYAYTLFLSDASRKEEVERLLREVIESKDRQVLPDAHLFLGYVLRTIPERAQKALKHFQIAVELNPHSHEAKRALRLEQRRKERHSSLGNQLIPWLERGDKK